MFRPIHALFTAALLAAPAFAGDLGVGDEAPAIAVADWVKGEPVSSFQEDQVYVVEFWATWCGPCRKTIPHLSELQEKYGDEVVFMGISVWENDYSAVPRFVEKMGDKMAYRVATDEVENGEGRMAKTWMEAAGQNGIPAAFVVNGEGRIAWIGHPIRMDEPLAEIVSGDWDVASAAEERAATRAKEAKYEELMKRISTAEQEGEWGVVLAKVDELMEVAPKVKSLVSPMRFKALLMLGQLEKGYAYGAELVDGMAKDSARTLNAIAWTIVDPEVELEERDLELALRAAQRANELTQGEEPSILDTLAKIRFDMGQIERAIELQEKALELAKDAGYPTEVRQEFEERLQTYRDAAKT